MCAAKKEEKKKEFGIKTVNGKTEIWYANGILTENGFEKIYEEYNDSTDNMCHWISDDMSFENNDIENFLDLIINSKYLSDGLLWGIALATWPVISRQLYDAKLPTPIVFFTGEPATLKTSISRMFAILPVLMDSQSFVIIERKGARLWEKNRKKEHLQDTMKISKKALFVS